MYVNYTYIVIYRLLIILTMSYFHISKSFNSLSGAYMRR